MGYSKASARASVNSNRLLAGLGLHKAMVSPQDSKLWGCGFCCQMVPLPAAGF